MSRKKPIKDEDDLDDFLDRLGLGSSENSAPTAPTPSKTSAVGKNDDTYASLAANAEATKKDEDISDEISDADPVDIPHDNLDDLDGDLFKKKTPNLSSAVTKKPSVIASKQPATVVLPKNSDLPSVDQKSSVGASQSPGASRRLEVDRPPTRSGANAVTKKKDDVQFDDDDVLGSMDFDSSPLNKKKSEQKPSTAEDTRAAKSIFDDFVRNKTPERPSTGDERDPYALNTRVQNQSKAAVVKENTDDEYLFGGYKPSAVSSSRPSSKRSVRFEGDDFGFGSGSASRPASSSKNRDSLLFESNDDWLNIATGGENKDLPKTNFERTDKPLAKPHTALPVESEPSTDWLGLSRLGSPRTGDEREAQASGISKSATVNPAKVVKSTPVTTVNRQLEISADEPSKSDNRLGIGRSDKFDLTDGYSKPSVKKDVKSLLQDDDDDFLGLKGNYAKQLAAGDDDLRSRKAGNKPGEMDGAGYLGGKRNSKTDTTGDYDWMGSKSKDTKQNGKNSSVHDWLGAADTTENKGQNEYPGLDDDLDLGSPKISTMKTPFTETNDIIPHSVRRNLSMSLPWETTETKTEPEFARNKSRSDTLMESKPPPHFTASKTEPAPPAVHQMQPSTADILHIDSDSARNHFDARSVASSNIISEAPISEQIRKQEEEFQKHQQEFLKQQEDQQRKRQQLVDEMNLQRQEQLRKQHDEQMKLLRQKQELLMQSTAPGIGIFGGDMVEELQGRIKQLEAKKKKVPTATLR